MVYESRYSTIKISVIVLALLLLSLAIIFDIGLFHLHDEVQTVEKHEESIEIEGIE